MTEQMFVGNEQLTQKKFELLNRTTNIVVDMDDDDWEFIGNNKTQDMKDFRRLGIEINCMVHNDWIEGAHGIARIWIYKRECEHEDDIAHKYAGYKYSSYNKN